MAGASSANNDVTRVSALGLNPNGVALFLALGVVAGLGKLLTTRRPIWFIPLGIMIASFPLAKSRSSLVIVAGGLLGFVIFSRSMRLRVAAIVVTGLVILIIPNVRTRIVDATLQGRAHQLSAESDASRRHAAIKALPPRHAAPGAGHRVDPVPAGGRSPTPAWGWPSTPTTTTCASSRRRAGPPCSCSSRSSSWRSGGRSEDDLDWALKALLCAMAVSLVTANVLYNIPSAFPYMAVIGTMAGTDYVRRTERIEAREAERTARIGGVLGVDTTSGTP